MAGDVSISATIKLYLPYGDPRRLRTAEISNWSGKAVAAPRTDLEPLLARGELNQAGVYILTGTDPGSGAPLAYVGEAEVIGTRLRQHQKNKDFWVHVILFLSKDENLTKAHVRYLEGRLINDAIAAGRVSLENNQVSGSKLPESDTQDMEVFLSKARQLLPVLGSDLVTPKPRSTDSEARSVESLTCAIKGWKAEGRRTADGFLIFKGSEAVRDARPSAREGQVVRMREQLLQDGVLVEKGERLVFTRDAEFSSPSAAGAVVRGGNTNGLTAWKTSSGKRLRDIEG